MKALRAACRIYRDSFRSEEADRLLPAMLILVGVCVACAIAARLMA